MESTADKARAFGYALLLHLAAAVVMFVGLWWSSPSPQPSVRGSVIEAVLVSAPAAPAPPSRVRETAPVETAPPPQPEPEPAPQQAPTPPQQQPQTEPPRPDLVERERVARLAREQAEEQAREEAIERRRQEQVLLEEKRKQEEAEQRQRLTTMEEERQKQLADIRRQREQAENERKEAEARLDDIAEQRRQQAAEAVPTEAPPTPLLGNEGVNDDLAGRYALAIQQAVERNWIRPETIRPGQACEVRIVQIPGGEVITATVMPSCPYDELGRRSVEAAVLRAQPLPYGGYESVFRREINFKFRAPEG